MRVDTAAVTTPPAGYGTITDITLDRPQAGANAVSMSIGNQFNYLFSEYFKGILFVALCAFFIFIVPTFVVKPAMLRQMIFRGIKRTFDIIGSIVGLILTLPYSDQAGLSWTGLLFSGSGWSRSQETGPSLLPEDGFR